MKRHEEHRYLSIREHPGSAQVSSRISGKPIAFLYGAAPPVRLEL